MSEPGFASLGPTLLARKGGAKPAMRPQVAPLVTDESEIAELADDQLEDLGWNDMGHDQGGHDDGLAYDDEVDSEFEGGADIVPINAEVSADHLTSGTGPIVRRQQRRLEERVLADAAMTGPDDREAEYDNAADEDEDEDESLYGEELDGEDLDDEQAYGSLAPEPAPVVVTARKRISALQSAPASRPTRAPTVQVGRRAAFTLRLDADRHLKLRLAATMQGVSAQALVTQALDALLAEFDDLDVIANHLKRH